MDTGPLLCAGAMESKNGLNLLHRRFKQRGVAILKPEAVEMELRGQARQAERGGYQGRLGRAAKKVWDQSRSTDFMDVDQTPWTSRERHPLRQALEEEITRKAAAGRNPPKLTGHDGEIDAMLLASRENAILLSNDGPARAVAKRRGLTVATFADILAAELGDATMLPDDVTLVISQIAAADIHIGIHNPTVLDIIERPPVPGL